MPRNRPLPLDAVGVGLALGFGLAVGVGAFASLPDRGDAPAAPAAVDAPVRSAVDAERRTPVVQAVERVAPAVVSITSEVPASDPFLVFRGGGTRASEGSGVVIRADGIVLTNAHVVEGAQRIRAAFADGDTTEAELVGIAPDLDLAVLRLRGATGLVAAPAGSSADLMLGEPVIAIGNPFGLGHTVTTGVVSAVSRPLETDQRVYQDFIQTDASINPGNSGGPLLDVNGRLVGINTAIRADAQGIGFAIPADRALKVAWDLVDYGQVRIAWLGVDVEDVVLDRRGRRVAPRVERVHAGSPATAAGLETGDVLLAVDGRTVQSRSDLNAYLATLDADHDVQLDVLRGGSPVQVGLHTGAVPDAVVDATLTRVLGVELGSGGRGGVAVSAVDRAGAFARRGLRPGDAILAVNGTATPTPEALRVALRQAKAAHRTRALFTIRRGDASARLTLPI